MKKVLVLAFIAVLAVAGFVFAGTGKDAGKKMCGMHGMEGKEMMHGMCCMKGAEMAVTETKDGVTISITGKDKETVAKIQEAAKQMQKCHAAKAEAAGKEDAEYVVCPVMGEKIRKDKAFAVKEYKGKKYYLCCAKCVGEFDKDPEKYAK